ncbi:MAG: hypothetical protein JWQ71_4144 [Pedosphaera sp.]|nr:hypothetical protein [Pedosphaera sp.]
MNVPFNALAAVYHFLRTGLRGLSKSGFIAHFPPTLFKQLRGTTLSASLLVYLATPSRSRGENSVTAKYENYKEDGHRMEITTTGLQFDTSLTTSLRASGELIYDSISGATPTGAPPPPGSDQVPLARLRDIRRGGFLELSQSWGPQTFSPQFAYSKEGDYVSYGAALNYSLDLNQKNTTLKLGLANNFDDVLPGHSSFLKKEQDKNTFAAIAGITQLLTPKTILTVNGSVSFESGYLTDPYRGFTFESFPGALFPELRPHHRNGQSLYVLLTQFITPVNASVESSYRLHHDSFGIWSHTLELDWLQKVGSDVIFQPFVRYYHQTAADFYFVQLPTDPIIDPTVVPAFYSADYRLARMETWTVGLKAIIKVCDHFSLNGAYQRYEMLGRDGETSPSAFPKANIFTVGGTLWF